ncbi:unnamed protein product [Phytophthora fragariaefolia]|uniref:glucan endo-1,3-beta-D-glucosidase n=1 Tax=Phytophthora fragariaefolia TaxID=1490495 RepID=A0A9W6UEG4_9STRA|nr:unnamed protein product [Phytophthora fragariaefolia]
MYSNSNCNVRVGANWRDPKVKSLRCVEHGEGQDRAGIEACEEKLTCAGAATGSASCAAMDLCVPCRACILRSTGLSEVDASDGPPLKSSCCKSHFETRVLGNKVAPCASTTLTMFAASTSMLAFGLAVSAIGQTAAVTSRNLTSSNPAAYMATTYSAMHSTAYPLTSSETLDTTALEEAIDADMELIAQSFTHVRTFYSQFYGVGVAQYASAHGIKLHLGVYMTDESWQQDQIDDAVAAVQDYPGTVEAILIGNENLYTGTTASEIIAIATSIKDTLGDSADGILFGTVQRSTEYLDTDYDDQINQLSESLDILGINIYPFFDDSYDSSEPTTLLDSVWDAIAAKYSVSQMLMCETGFPTAGDPSTLSPDVTPSLDSSIQFFTAVASWVPTGAETSLKFWFDFFDRRSDDTSVDVELERHFGIYTYDSQLKSEDYLTALGGASAVSFSSISSTASSESIAAQTSGEASTQVQTLGSTSTTSTSSESTSSQTQTSDSSQTQSQAQTSGSTQTQTTESTTVTTAPTSTKAAADSFTASTVNTTTSAPATTSPTPTVAGVAPTATNICVAHMPYALSIDQQANISVLASLEAMNVLTSADLGADGVPLLRTGADGADDEEFLLASFRAVELHAAGDAGEDDDGEELALPHSGAAGSLFVTTRRVVWLGAAMGSRVGYAWEMSAVTLHAISRDPAAFPRPCLLVRAAAATVAAVADLLIVVSCCVAATAVQELFDAFCKSAEMNPDDEEEDDDDGWICDEDEVMDGARAAQLAAHFDSMLQVSPGLENGATEAGQFDDADEDSLL